MAYKFEIYRDKTKAFRVRFVAANGDTIFSTQGYAAKVSAKNAIKSIIKNTPKAAIEDSSDLRKKSSAASAKKTAKKATKKRGRKKKSARKAR